MIEGVIRTRVGYAGGRQAAHGDAGAATVFHQALGVVGQVVLAGALKGLEGGAVAVAGSLATLIAVIWIIPHFAPGTAGYGFHGRWQPWFDPLDSTPAVLALLAAACGRDNFSTVQRLLAPSGDAVNFGDVILGQTDERVLTLGFEKQSESNATWALSLPQPFSVVSSRGIVWPFNV